MTERDQEEQRGPDQEPRTGGVALVEHHTLSIDGRPRYFTAAGGETPTHIAFPLAQAEALIDPTDPAVRERVTEAMRDRFNADGVYVLPGDIDAVLAALRGAK